MRLRGWVLGMAFGLTFATVSRVEAQATSDHAPLAFDVVSIKTNRSASGAWMLDGRKEKFSGQNVSIVALLGEAYDLNPDMVFGVPAAMRSARFDVEAKVVDVDAEMLKRMNDATTRVMVQKFLEERFALKAHKEMKTLPVYEMVVDRSGLKTKPSKPEEKGELNRRNGEVNGRGMPMTAFALALTDLLKRTVFDKTGLGDAKYEFNLKWTPDSVADAGGESGPSIFTAMQEQMGLKLVPAKGPVETLVVDHVEMPTEN